jgi:hypothetical protein
MDWANERYVRLYTRDTMTWKRLPWQSRLLIPAIMRKLDRSGVIDLGEDGEDGIADFIEVPAEFVQAGLPELLRREVFVVRGKRLVMPNYIAAQETRQSDAQRQRDSRERRATAGDKPSPEPEDSHPPSPPVTSGHPESLQPSLAVPSLAEPEIPRARSNPNAKLCGRDLLAMFGKHRSRVFPTALPWVTARDPKGDAGTFAAGLGPEECADVEGTMRLALEHIRDGAKGWADERHKDPSFAFGAWKSGFHALREELHGCAPKSKAPANQPAPKPMAVVG